VDYDLVALLFVREPSDPLASLVKQIEQRLATAGKSPRTLGVYVIVVQNADGLDGRLQAMAQKAGLKRVALGIGTPPANYGVAAEADLTVVIYNPERRNKQQVRANFALRRGELDEAKTDAIVKAVSDVLPR
jgi:hypothetical protein